MSTVRVIESTTLLRASLDDVFEFFSRAENLGRITPQSMRFKILSPLPIEMREGALIDYQIRLLGLPMFWRTEITHWEPPFRFIDSQIRGPYRQWIHEHRFKEVPGGVEMYDRVDYIVPGGFLEPILTRVFVRPQVQRIFDFRARAIEKIFVG